MMCMGMAVGMAACSGVPRGPASSFEAAFAGHHSGLAAVSAGGDAAVRPLPRMNAREALEERLPGGVRLASANAVAAADVPMTIPPLEDDEVLGEYDPWEPFNRKMFAFNRQLDRFVLKPVATVWDTVLPDLAQESLGNFFSNLSMPPRLVNNLFQRNIEGAGREFGALFPQPLDGRARLLRCGHRAGPRQERCGYRSDAGRLWCRTRSLPGLAPLTAADGP